METAPCTGSPATHESLVVFSLDALAENQPDGPVSVVVAFFTDSRSSEYEAPQ